MKRTNWERFEKTLLKRRAMLLGDVNSMSDEALNMNRSSAGDLSNMPIHMADLGTDNFEQEFTIELIQNEAKELEEIEAALARIKDGSFGRCAECDTAIGRERLAAIPYARLCIECRRKEEMS